MKSNRGTNKTSVTYLRTGPYFTMNAADPSGMAKTTHSCKYLIPFTFSICVCSAGAACGRCSACISNPEIAPSNFCRSSCLACVAGALCKSKVTVSLCFSLDHKITKCTFDKIGRAFGRMNRDAQGNLVWEKGGGAGAQPFFVATYKCTDGSTVEKAGLNLDRQTFPRDINEQKIPIYQQTPCTGGEEATGTTCPLDKLSPLKKY